MSEPGAPAAAGAAPGRTARIVIVTVLLLLVVIFVASTLRRPSVPVFTPTPPQPVEIGDRLLGPVTYTIDASSPDVWQYFDFSRGSVVPPGDPLGWDLAFRRFHIIANGGAGFAGQGGIRELQHTPFDSVPVAPDTGYTASSARGDSTNTAIAHWYAYSWTSHILRPRPSTWIVRTADGRYARLQILSYYCPGAEPGCVTFRFVYAGAGGRAFGK